MEDWITGVMEDYGYVGIFFLIMLENVFPPIPSEVILTFGGFMTSTAQLTKPGVIAASTGGSVAGAIVLYGLGRYMNVEKLEKIVRKQGKWLRLKPEDLHKADAWFDNHGTWAVFFGRFVPLVRSLISVPAGSSGMGFFKFLLLTALGTFIWNSVLVWLGASVGENWEDIVDRLGIYSNTVYVLLGAGLVAGIIWYIRKAKSEE